MPKHKLKKKTWPTKAHVRGGNPWVPHPDKPGYLINVMDGNVKKAKTKSKKK